MLEKIKAIIKDEKYQSYIQFIKYGLVGLSNSVVAYVFYLICIWFMRNLNWDKDYILANAISFTISVFWSFYWNNKYVFKEEEDKKRNMWIALGKCFLAYGFTGYILNNILSYVWIEMDVLNGPIGILYNSFPSIQMEMLEIKKTIAPILNLIFSVPINFFLNKLWAFKD